VKEIIGKLNKHFENRIRLGIMSVLMVNEAVDFTTLKELLNTTDGNLASHLTSLERNGLIKVKKRFIGRKPNTSYSVSGIGNKAFKEHLDYLAKLLQQQPK
jgi:DNA-binding MarR family transcriptional regulator